MNETSKLLLSLTLVAAGFFGASLFGPPDLTGRVLGRWGAPAVDTTEGLTPLPPEQLHAQEPLGTDFAAEPLSLEFGRFENAKPIAERAAPEEDSLVTLAAAEAPPVADSKVERPAPFETPAWGSVAQQPNTESGIASAWGTPSATDTPWSATPLHSSPVTRYAAKPVGRAASVSKSMIEHVVADGDSLRRLAKHYLGDEARADELYELNQDRLDSAELLPIGVMLRVPQEMRPSTRQESPSLLLDNAWGAPALESPFRTVAAPTAGGTETAARPSRLVPVGGAAERETPAPAPGAMVSDWIW